MQNLAHDIQFCCIAKQYINAIVSQEETFQLSFPVSDYELWKQYQLITIDVTDTII